MPDVATQGQIAAEIWKDEKFATAWAEGDTVEGLLTLPRRIAAAVVSLDRPDSKLVVDIGSGPGAFLSVFLDEFPGARGLWTDASDAMRTKAEASLASHGDRVDFKIVDMSDLGALPRGIDVLLTSRAVHHLDKSGLDEFYAAVSEVLAPGGWLVNLDHTGPGEMWDARLRAARKTIIPPRPKGEGHHHDGPLTSVTDHYDALTKAGFTDFDAPWRGFFTVLFMARKSD